MNSGPTRAGTGHFDEANNIFAQTAEAVAKGDTPNWVDFKCDSIRFRLGCGQQRSCGTVHEVGLPTPKMRPDCEAVPTNMRPDCFAVPS